MSARSLPPMALLYDALHKNRRVRNRVEHVPVRPTREVLKSPHLIAPSVPSVSTSGSSVMSSVSSKSDVHSLADTDLCISSPVWAVPGDLVGAVQDVHELCMADVPPRPGPRKLAIRQK